MSDQEIVMNSRRPYLLRAMYEWILGNECAPFMLVDSNMEGVVVPEHYAEEGKIVLNVSPSAVRDFSVDNDWVEFNARFNGRAMGLRFPVDAVLAIYARENGEGMIFGPAVAEITTDEASEAAPALVSVDQLLADPAVDDESDRDGSADVVSDGPDEDPPTPRPPKGKPTLRVVK